MFIGQRESGLLWLMKTLFQFFLILSRNTQVFSQISRFLDLDLQVFDLLGLKGLLGTLCSGSSVLLK